MAKKTSSSKSSKLPPRTSKLAAATAEEAMPTEQPALEEQTSIEETKAQQRLLNIFGDTFKDVLGADDFNTVLQRVKQALFNRDFEAAFGSEQFLEVYAARWSPARALCYSRVFNQITGDLEPLLLTAAAGDTGDAYNDEAERGRASPTVDAGEEEWEESTKKHATTDNTLKVFAIGGGAAEIVAFGEYLRGATSNVAGDITLLDVGPWGEVVEKLHTGLTTPPVLSKYASAAAKAANAALVEPATRLRSTFMQQDILQLDSDSLSNFLGKTPVIITMLFTLNELYTSGGIKLTTAFLRNLSVAIPTSSLLLVVDSPGSYSEAAVGKEAKKYPMQWLLDHTLLQTDKLPSEGCTWEKLKSHDSIWFRLGEGLRYPIALQDMRYQMHLYCANPRPSD
ncbi:uncharacterized protein F4822DRAFT_211733 [Hypoxylon trugodes]|uniref:uncharacterized protein n=1 Tax=Hypoxylon trugodes TaxID=326681 RepID=UPI00219BBE72|nr:uncharacterized protein F4822DRAFT_211733 [Hypoxylon trugodes]KAI1389740.1 hypothetical protein F4822DRAFT_211733 [Hypoxylon trugodes]